MSNKLWKTNKEQPSGCCRGHQGRPAQKKNDQAWQTKYYCLRRGMLWSQLYLCGQFHFTTHRMINYCEQSLPPLLASPSQFSSSWRIFHTPARTWFSSFQQWLPNQRLHWSLLTSLMTCQLYTESLQQCLQNLCASTTSIPCHVCCYTQTGMILRRVSSLQRSIFLCSDMDILDVCLLSETSYGGHWHLRNVGNQTSECHALYVLQVCIVDESAYQNRHVILWAMQHCTVHGQLPIRTSSLTFCVKQVRISLPLSRVVWNIVQRQLRRRQTCDARISFQECSALCHSHHVCVLQTLHVRKLRIKTVVHCMFLLKQTFCCYFSFHVCYYA